MTIKTTQEIINDWDEYKKKIDFDEDWTQEYDDYLNTKWKKIELDNENDKQEK